VSDGEFSLALRVYIEDTDAGGIVYYVNYLKFLERARTEFMRSIGFDRAAIFTEDLMFVVREVALTYHRPAVLDDELLATAAVAELGAASLGLRQRVLRAGEVLVDGSVMLACVDRKTMKPRRLPRALKARLAGVLQPD
jgi:tol-pal system-associated acyl-CoA thioesterase